MIKKAIVIEKEDAVDIQAYLQLILDNDKIIDDYYPKETGYKVYGHIRTLIEQLHECE